MKTSLDDFGITVTPEWLDTFRPPFEVTNERQIMATGHVAPRNDPDIRESNRKTMAFPHCPLLLDNIKSIVKPGDCALDVGAFIGDNSWEFLEYGLKVVGIEPFLDAYECALVNAPDAFFIHAAAGNGELLWLEYSCRGDNHGMRTVSLTPAGDKQVFKSLRIDDLGITKLELLKVDAEGSEMRVIEGAKETISNLKPVLIIEANPFFVGQNGCDILKSTMEQMGYTVTGESERASWDWIGIPK